MQTGREGDVAHYECIRSAVVCSENRQRVAGTRRVRQPERVRSPAGTGDTPECSICRTNVIADDWACTPLPRQNFHGKEGVPGSSPGEGLKFLQIGILCCLVRRGREDEYGGGHVSPDLQELFDQCGLRGRGRGHCEGTWPASTGWNAARTKPKRRAPDQTQRVSANRSSNGTTRAICCSSLSLNSVAIASSTDSLTICRFCRRNCWPAGAISISTLRRSEGSGRRAISPRSSSALNVFPSAQSCEPEGPKDLTERL
jgi:hypothetical protein